MDINYINKKLSEGLTVTQVRTELGMSDKTFRKKIKELGYKYNNKSKNYTKVTEVVNYQSSEIVAQGENYNNNQLVVSNAEYEKFINTLNNINVMNEKLEEVYKWYELQNNVIEKATLNIEPNNNDTVTRSFKVYEDVYKEFTQLCKNNSTYKVQDLLSQALKEFCNKYK